MKRGRCLFPIFDSRMLRSSICESLRSLAHSNCVTFNQAALRAVLNPENMSSSAQATQIPVRFVCVYASSTLPFLAVSNRFNRCLDHCFHSFRSLFESISIAYKTLQLNYFVFKTFYLLPFLASLSRPQEPFDPLPFPNSLPFPFSIFQHCLQSSTQLLLYFFIETCSSH